MPGRLVEPLRFPLAERLEDSPIPPGSPRPPADSVERGRERTEQLMLITSAIADAVTPTQVFDAVVDEVAAAVGAETAGLWTSLRGEPSASLARSIGYSDAAQRLFEELSLEPRGRIPVADVILGGEPLFIASREELLQHYPHLAKDTRAGSYRVACLPIEVGGRTFGALAFTFEGAAPFDDDERSFLRIVARHSGQALERLRLLEAEHRARVRAEILMRLAEAVIESERIETVFEAALDAITRALHAERAAVFLLDGGGVMRCRAWRGVSGAYRARVEGCSPWAREGRAAEPIVVPDVTAEASLAAYLRDFAAEGIRGVAFFPLLSGGAVVGKFVVYYAEPARVDAHGVDVGRAIASHVATAAARFAALDELRDAVHFSEMFTAILGHDLRNPLGGIMAAAQLAMRRVEGEKLLKPLGRIVNSAERMSRMIDQLLDFTRVRVGAGIPLKPAAADLDPILRQVVEELADANPAWSIRVDCGGDTRGVWDPDRLAQVFSNLVGNAVQHGDPAGGVIVTARGTDPERIVVEVHNQGEVPPELVPTLFEPMTGGDRRREKSIGLGLGLFITRQITAAHGGVIDVRSDPAAGTTISVSLPRVSRGATAELAR